MNGNRALNARAQSSVELLVIMAVALVILGVLVSLVSDQVGKLQREQAVKMTDASVKKIVEGVNEVYLQGAGATRQVLVTWPDGVKADESYILDHSIVVSIAGTTIVGTTKPVITGSLPVSGGLLPIRLKAFDGFVSIGDVSLLANPSSVFTALNRDENSGTSITLTNAAAQNATLTFTTDWNYGLLDLNVVPSASTISAGSSIGVDLNFHAHTTAVGAYSGKLTVQATFPGRVETVVIPIIAQVYTGHTGDLSVYPTSLTLNTFGADTNTFTVQVCNTGTSALKSVSFTPTGGTPGSWVTGLDTLATLDALSCENVDVTVTVPDGTALGSSSGAIVVEDFSGNNSYVLPLTVNVQGMSSVFSLDWSTASVLQGQISGFRVTNGGTKAVQINSMIVRNWWQCDLQKGNLTSIIINNQQRFNGSVSDGNLADVTDFNIPVLTSWISNAFTFSQNINDDNETFIVDVNFSDGTNYTSASFGTGCEGDTNAPSMVNDLVASSGPNPKEVVLRFTYSGDDEMVGLATGGIIKYSTASIDNESEWDAASTLNYVFPKQAPGTSGMVTITGLDIGYTYYFAMKFFDENANHGPISNLAPIRPWNSFQFLGNDFNFSRAPLNNSLIPSDVNSFRLTNISGTLSGARLVFRIYDDSDPNNTWIMALDMNTTHLGRIRIWYPMSNQVGVPGSAATFDVNTNTSLSGTINLLNATLIPSNYRYNGSAVNNSLNNHFYVDTVSRVTDFNVIMDADYSTSLGGGDPPGAS